MHVAICLSYNSPMGGLHLNVFDTCRQLRAAGHRVSVFCSGGPFGEMLRDIGCFVRLLGARPSTAYTFDLVHVHPGVSRQLGERLARDLNIPLFATFHGKWFNRIERSTAPYTHLFGVSPAICDRLKKALPEARARISLMPNAIAPTEDSAPRRPRTANGGLDILVASRLAADKHPVTETLLALWALQQRRGDTALRWHIAGQGAGLEQLQAFCAAHPAFTAQVQLHGWLESPQLHALMGRCDVALSPGRSALEAMNMARAVIPLGSGGCQGLLTPARFEECAYSNFGGAFGRVTQDPAQVFEDLQQLAHSGAAPALGGDMQRLVRQNFDLHTHHKRLMKFYTKAVRDNRAQSTP